MDEQVIECDADKLADSLAHAAKNLGYQQGAQQDPDLHEYIRVEEAKAALLTYIAALKEEIAELGDVAKGCAKREREALAKHPTKGWQDDDGKRVAEGIRQEVYRLRRSNGSNLVCPLAYAENLARAALDALKQSS